MSPTLHPGIVRLAQEVLPPDSGPLAGDDTPDARHRLAEAVGPELARLLLFALAAPYGERPGGGLRTRSAP